MTVRTELLRNRETTIDTGSAVFFYSTLMQNLEGVPDDSLVYVLTNLGVQFAPEPDKTLSSEQSSPLFKCSQAYYRMD